MSIKVKHKEITHRMTLINDFNAKYKHPLVTNLRPYLKKYLDAYTNYQDFKKTIVKFFGKEKLLRLKSELLSKLERLNQELDDIGLDIIRYLATLQPQKINEFIEKTYSGCIFLSREMSKKADIYLREPTLKKVKSEIKLINSGPRDHFFIAYSYDLEQSNYNRHNKNIPAEFTPYAGATL